MEIYCVGCEKDVEPTLVTGHTVYHHRKDLWLLPFWQCDECKNFVGCHKNSKKNRPLGCIATQELRVARSKIHTILDPIWQSGRATRDQVYEKLNQELGYKYHTANIRSVKDAKHVMFVVRGLYG